MKPTKLMSELISELSFPEWEKPKGKKASFDTMLASMAGCGTLVGSFGGVPGTFVGMVIGGLLGFYFSKHSNDC